MSTTTDKAQYYLNNLEQEVAFLTRRAASIEQEARISKREEALATIAAHGCGGVLCVCCPLRTTTADDRSDLCKIALALSYQTVGYANTLYTMESDTECGSETPQIGE